MRLGILTQYYPPEVGAPQARLSELAQRFVQRGHEVVVLTAMPNYPTGRVLPGYGGLMRTEQRDGIRIMRTYIYPTQRADLLHRLANYFSFVFSSGALGTALLPKVDYLLVESPPLFLGLAGVWLSRMKRARLIFNVSDLWPESAVHLDVISRESAAYRASVWLEAFCYAKAWLVTGQSRGILASIQQRFPDRPTFHLSNGVDTDRFHPGRATAEARAVIAGATQEKDNFLVLYAGLHGLAQGLDTVVEAAARLQGQGVEFVLVGDGPEKAVLMQRARESRIINVRFLDPVPAQEVPALIAAADVVVVPLKKHIPGAVPSKLYEAMASGVAVVLAADGEAADIVRRHDAGIVVRPGEVGALADAVFRLRENPVLRARLGRNGREAALREFDRSAIASRFIQFLERARVQPSAGLTEFGATSLEASPAEELSPRLLGDA